MSLLLVSVTVATPWCSGLGPGEGLDFGVLLEARDAILPADAAVLVAAKGQIGAVWCTAVDAQAAGPDTAGHCQRPLERSGVHAAGKPVDAVIGDTHRVIVVLERDHDKDRAEDFLLRDRHRVVHICEKGRLDIPALRQMFRPAAAEGECRTLLDALLDVT